MRNGADHSAPPGDASSPVDAALRLSAKRRRRRGADLARRLADFLWGFVRFGHWNPFIRV